MNNFVSFFKIFDLKVAAGFLSVLSLFVIYFSPFWWPSSNSNAVALIRVFVFLAALFFIVKNFFGFFKKRAEFKVNYYLIFFIMLFSYLLVNTFFLEGGGQSVRRVVFLMCFFISIYYLEINQGVVRGLLIVLAVSGACFALYSIISMYSMDLLPTGYRQGGLMSSAHPSVAYFGNTIVAAMHYSVTFSILTYLFLTETKKVLLILWFSFLILVFAYIALTFSRSGWIACAVAGFSIYCFTFDKSKIRFYFIPILGCGVLAYFALNFLTLELYGRGLTSRDEIWAVVLSRMPGHWIFGYGLSAHFEPIPVLNGAVFVNNSHNLYLEILYKTGVVGLLLFIASVASALFALYKGTKNAIYSNLAILLFSVLLAVLIVMLTELNGWISSPNLLWQWLWVPLAFSLNMSRRLDQITSKPI